MTSHKEVKGGSTTALRLESSAAAGNKDNSRRTDIGRQVEEYLTSIKQELTANQNPRLKVEQSRLQDLLESYRKLCRVYERNKDGVPEVTGEKINEQLPEIYSVLYPGLYENQREKEKDKLRKSFVKGRTPSESCVPKNLKFQTSRGQDVQDTRQKEKDRFVRLISSAPSAFLQGPQQKKTTSRRYLLTSSAAASRSPQKREDAREKEKERLAKILSSDFDPGPPKKRITTVSSTSKTSSSIQKKISAPIKGASSSRRDASKDSAVSKPTRPQVSAKGGMVKRDAGSLSTTRRMVSSSSERQDRKKKLLDLNNREYQEYLDKLQNRHIPKMDKAVLAREASLLDLTDDAVQYSPRSISVATQTDDIIQSPSSPQAFLDVERLFDQSKLFPEQKEAFITSPRAKLIKDLHGVSPCLPGASPMLTLPDQGDEKRKRSAYAEALKAQIDEKKRLEEEKRRKELEEDEYIEKRAREQQERLKEEWEREQSLRQDWLVQKEAQEETVRQKMAELELEARELKRQERLRKGGCGDRPISPAGTFPRTKLSPREVEQLLPQAMRDSMMSSIIAEKPRQKPLLLENNNSLQVNENVEGLTDVDISQEVELDRNSVDSNMIKGTKRSSSPVLPAVQTDSILKRSIYSSPRIEMIQGENEKEELLRGDKILTQLGVFRRELELEQERLQQRLLGQAQT